MAVNENKPNPVNVNPETGTAETNPNLVTALERTGQITNQPSDINQSLFNNALLRPISEAVGQINDIPEAEGLEFDSLNLRGGQEQFFEESSDLIASQTNLLQESLRRQFTQEVIPSVEQATQDRAVLSGQLTSDLGAMPDVSSRNASFVGNAQARGQQEMLNLYNQFSESLQQSQLQSQQSQLELLGKGLDTANQNRDFDFRQEQFEFQKYDTNRKFEASQDQWLTSMMGNLFQEGDDTGLRTLQGESADLELQLGQEELEAVRNRNTLFPLERESAILANRSQELKNALTGTDLTMAESTLPSTIARTITENNLATKSTEQQLKRIEEFELEIEGLATSVDILNNYEIGTEEYSKALESVVAYQNKYGQGAGLYWTQTPSMDEQGNITISTATDSNALETRGVFLNVDFDNPNYLSLTQGMDEDQKPHNIISQRVYEELINPGKDGISRIFNKVAIASDDNNKALLAINNTNPNSGDVGYNFFEIDMSNLDDAEKNALRNEIGNIENDEAVLQNFQNTINRFAEDGELINERVAADEFMVRFNKDSSYQGVRQKEFMRGTDNSQLLSALVVGTSDLTIGQLEEAGAIEWNKDDRRIDFSPIRRDFVTTHKPELEKLSNTGVDGLASYVDNDQQISLALNLYSGVATGSQLGEKAGLFIQDGSRPVESGEGREQSEFVYRFNDETRDFLETMRDTYRLVENKYTDPNEADQVMSSFAIGTLNLTKPQANGLVSLIKQL